MTKIIIALLGALFAPLTIIAIYLSVSRWPERWFTTESDYMVAGLAILGGLMAVWSLPLKASHRLIGAMLYAPSMGR